MAMHTRGVLAGLILVAQSVMPTASPDVELWRYAVTQGGLLIVALVLMYWNRVDTRTRHKENVEKLNVLVDLSSNTASVLAANTAAIQQLAHAVDRFERLR